MMNSLAYGIVAFLCFCCSVKADSSNVTSLLANCTNGGCDFEFIIDQYAVEATDIDELRSVVNNITIELPISGKAAGSVCGAVTKAIDTAENKIYYPGEYSYNQSSCHLNNMNVNFDVVIGNSQRAAQAIMEAALCFQSADPNKNCGALIPSKLNPVYSRDLTNFNGVMWDCQY
uniref:Uncharacterized protein n=1 Tax=Plectus sambesii TaxID=2011161 RepID=A0A914X061_9BILA